MSDTCFGRNRKEPLKRLREVLHRADGVLYIIRFLQNPSPFTVFHYAIEIIYLVFNVTIRILKLVWHSLILNNGMKIQLLVVKNEISKK
jgi:hypothetical protein